MAPPASSKGVLRRPLVIGIAIWAVIDAEFFRDFARAALVLGFLFSSSHANSSINGTQAARLPLLPRS